MNAQKSYTEYDVKSEQSDFVLGFNFDPNRDELECYLNYTPIDTLGISYTIISKNTIRFNPAISAGLLRVQRLTNLSEVPYKFKGGAKFLAQTMDDNFKFLLNVNRDSYDRMDYFRDQVRRDFNTLTSDLRATFSQMNLDITNRFNDLSSRVFTDNGILTNADISTIDYMGAYYVDVPTCTGLPDGFNDPVGGYLTLTKANGTVLRHLTTRWDAVIYWTKLGSRAWTKHDVSAVVTSVLASTAFTNRGNVSGGKVTDLTLQGTYHIEGVEDFPEGFGRTVGVLTVTRHGSFTLYELVDRYNPLNRYFRIGNGTWVNNSKTNNLGTLTGIEILKYTTEGDFYATDCLDFPSDFGRTVGMVSIQKFGSNRIIRLVDRYNPTRQYFSVNGAAWVGVGASTPYIAIGNVDGIDVGNYTNLGTCHFTNATNLPPEFGKNFGLLFVERYGSHWRRVVYDRTDIKNSWHRINIGEWVKLGSGAGGGGGGSTIDVDPTQLPSGIAQTDATSTTDVFYRHGGFMRVRQQEFHPWFFSSNDAIRVNNGDNMLNLLYAKYDELMAQHPDRITRTILGTEYTGLEVREYRIAAKFIGKHARSDARINTLPELLIMSGQHGQEYTHNIGLYLMLDEMLNNPRNEEVFMELNHNFHLRVMPAMNPWGVANANRRNSRGIDLNRNFANGWDIATGDKGEAPNSELESQILINWVNANKAKAFMLLNLHDHSDSALTWGTASHEWTQRALLHIFKKIGTWYDMNYNDQTPSVPISWLGDPRDGFSDKYVGLDLGLPTILFECPYIGHPKLSSNWIDIRLTTRQLFIETFRVLLQKYHNTFTYIF